MRQFLDLTSSRRAGHVTEALVKAHQLDPSTELRIANLSAIEALAFWSASSKPKPFDILGALLASCMVSEDSACPALRPLWADEAMHRAYSFIRLLKARCERTASQAFRSHWHKYWAASRLSHTLLGLQTDQAESEYSCDQALLEVVSDMISLFGTGFVSVRPTTVITKLHLPAYRRRALILLATELLINALTHAFGGEGGAGVLEVGLQTVSPQLARLYVADDGIGIGSPVPILPCSVTCTLVDLLQGELRYRSFGMWSTFAEITFPIRAA